MIISYSKLSLAITTGSSLVLLFELLNVDAQEKSTIQDKIRKEIYFKIFIIRDFNVSKVAKNNLK